MSVRSGVFIKYVVEFGDAASSPAAAAAGAVGAAIGTGGLPLKVSNDVLVGDVCIDADVTVKMSRWTTGTTFTITLYDLPEPKVKQLKDLAKGAALRATIKLGYFDTSVDLVVDGICEKVDSNATQDKLVTTIEGREKAFFACAIIRYGKSPHGDVSFAAAAADVLSAVAAGSSDPKLPVPPNCVDKSPEVKDLVKGDPMHNPSFSQKTALLVIDEIAKRAHAEFFIADGKVFLGSPIKYDPVVPPPQLDYAANLAKFDPLDLKIPGSNKLNRPDPDPSKAVKGFKFTALGDPTLRPGQTVIVKNIKNYPSSANPEFRIRHIEHQFSASAGYTCVGAATERLADGASAREIDFAIERGAAAAARDITDKIRSQAFESPVVEIVSVKAVADPYQADAYYGQPAAGSETQPSINIAVQQQDDNIYASKPIASSFAWRKCGLVTPVYPGMKAVMLHNRALASDGIVAGYIWSKQPDFAPPASHAGDWWLCLPIDFDATQAPSNQTKAVNDLTGNTGKRVIEVKGLRITVGAGKLASIGNRPTEGADDDFLIEHVSGTSVQIDSNGALTIDASKASLSIKGDVVIEGSLEIK
jgi:hypothetical protein